MDVSGFSNTPTQQPRYDYQSVPSSDDNSNSASVASGQVQSIPKDAASANSDKKDSGSSDASATSNKEGKTEHRAIEEHLRQSAEKANKELQSMNSTNSIQFSYHKQTRTVMIKVVDSVTQKTIREIPDQKHLDAIAKMWELAGILVDKKK